MKVESNDRERKREKRTVCVVLCDAMRKKKRKLRVYFGKGGDAYEDPTLLVGIGIG